MPITKLMLVKKLSQYPDNLAVRELLIGALSDKERTAYLALKVKPETTRAVAKSLKISIPNAGNILLRLYRMGLLERRSSTDEAGLFYVWKKR